MKKIYKYFILIPTVLILSACNSDSSLQSNLNPEERERMEMKEWRWKEGVRGWRWRGWRWKK